MNWCVIKDGEHSLRRPEMRLTLYRKLDGVSRGEPGCALSGPHGHRPQRTP